MAILLVDKKRILCDFNCFHRIDAITLFATLLACYSITSACASLWLSHKNLARILNIVRLLDIRFARTAGSLASAATNSPRRSLHLGSSPRSMRSAKACTSARSPLP